MMWVHGEGGAGVGRVNCKMELGRKVTLPCIQVSCWPLLQEEGQALDCWSPFPQGNQDSTLSGKNRSPWGASVCRREESNWLELRARKWAFPSPAQARIVYRILP